MSDFNHAGKPGRILLLGALLLAAVGSAAIFQPYLHPILIALLLSTFCQPIHERLSALLGERPGWAALITCLLMTFVVVVPLVLALIALLNQGAGYALVLIDWVSDGGFSDAMSWPLVVWVTSKLETWLPAEFLSPDSLKQQVMTTATGLSSVLLNFSRQLAGGLLKMVFDLGLMVLVLFFALRDQDKLMVFLRNAIPLSRSQEDHLLEETASVTRSVLLGNVVTALLQGIAGGLAMWAAGFPGFFWGAMIAFASFIPVIGTALIWLPASLYLLFTGDTSWGIALIAWSIVVVGSIDNIIRPMLMSGASSINGLVIFLAIIGGLQLFGLIGLLYGPLIISLTLVLYRMYAQEFREFLNIQDAS
jgi:predicted PurR-regulated permease PerM